MTRPCGLPAAFGFGSGRTRRRSGRRLRRVPPEPSSPAHGAPAVPSAHSIGGACRRHGVHRSIFTLFTDLGDDFLFTVFADDLNFESVHARAVEAPRQQWAVFEAAAVPVADGSATPCPLWKVFARRST